MSLYSGYCGNPQIAGDTDPIDLGGGAEVTYCENFKYLGGTLDAKASDVTEITKRIRSASSIFGMMTKRIFGNKQIISSTGNVASAIQLYCIGHFTLWLRDLDRNGRADAQARSFLRKLHSYDVWSDPQATMEEKDFK